MHGYMAARKKRKNVWLGALAILALCCPAPVFAQAPSTPQKHSPQMKREPLKKKMQEESYVLVGAGDIASCLQPEGAQATAKLIERIPGTVFVTGDLAYESGSPDEFEFCYGPTWGRFKGRTRPTLGNHEYVNPTAHGYFEYWGAQAGPAGKGYYSFDLGGWHIVALNTNCYARGLGGCGTGSPQETWLKADLAKHPDACIVAYGHHTLFSSGFFRGHALHRELKPLWQDLYAAHTDLVLAGHEHSYERFAAQDPDGNPDTEHGIREIVVGTGGRSHTLLGFVTPNSEVRNWDTFGVLKLTLLPGKYMWEFIPVEGRTFRDSGNGVCHNQAKAAN
jgi:hypothetical protein